MLKYKYYRYIIVFDDDCKSGNRIVPFKCDRFKTLLIIYFFSMFFWDLKKSKLCHFESDIVLDKLTVVS